MKELRKIEVELLSTRELKKIKGGLGGDIANECLSAGDLCHSMVVLKCCGTCDNGGSQWGICK